jgi:hypothetical protein
MTSEQLVDAARGVRPNFLTDTRNRRETPTPACREPADGYLTNWCACGAHLCSCASRCRNRAACSWCAVLVLNSWCSKLSRCGQLEADKPHTPCRCNAPLRAPAGRRQRGTPTLDRASALRPHAISSDTAARLALRSAARLSPRGRPHTVGHDGQPKYRWVLPRDVSEHKDVAALPRGGADRAGLRRSVPRYRCCRPDQIGPARIIRRLRDLQMPVHHTREEQQ